MSFTSNNKHYNNNYNILKQIANKYKKGSELPWNRHVLKDLLVNVVYIGNLAQGRSSQCLYKGEKYHWTKEADWDVVEGTHEPIISMELWNTVQEINKKVSSNATKSFGRYAHSYPKLFHPQKSPARRIYRWDSPTAPPGAYNRLSHWQ